MSADASPAEAAVAVGERGRLGGRRSWALPRFLLRRDPFACFLVLAFLLAALVGLVFSPGSPNAVDLLARLEGPSSAHLLGTDQYGRDLLSRVFVASGIALQAAAIVLAVGALVGIPLGAIAGTLGGWVDMVLSRIVEIIQGFPVILLAIMFVAVTGRSLLHAMIAVGIGAIPDFFRITRSVGIQLRSREFVEAARGYGAGRLQIVRSEILPNAVGPLAVVASFDAAGAIMYESALSFIGLGAQPPTASFGRMLFEAKGYLAGDPSYAICVGTVLVLVILGLNLLGDALSDYFQGGDR